MFRKIVICFTLMCFIICIQGCTSRHVVHRGILKSKPEHKNIIVETIDGDVYEFNRNAVIIGDMVVGYANDSAYVKIPIEDVESVYVLRYDATKTILYTFGAAGILVGGIVILFIIDKLIHGPMDIPN